MQRAILIDGNFMLMRCYSALNKEANENFMTIKTPEESERQYQLRRNKDINEFTKLLCKHMNTIVQRYGYCSTIIMCKDGKSWRKDVPMLQPMKYLPGDVDSSAADDDGYKENRVKDVRTDWDVVYGLFEKFCKAIESSFKVAYLLTPGAEGDDWMWFASRWIKKELDLHSLIYCSDGDITQTVEDYIAIARQVKTKLGEHGELVTSVKLGALFTKLSNVSIFDINHAQLAHINELFKEVKSGGVHHIMANKASAILFKVMAGDKKDNIPATVEYSKSGSTWKRPNDTMWEKFLVDNDLTLAPIPEDIEIVIPAPKPVKVPKPKKPKKGEIVPEPVEVVPEVLIQTEPTIIKKTLQPITMDHLYDEVFIRRYFTEFFSVELKKTTGKDMDIEHAMKIYRNNLKLMHLDKKQIPEYVFDGMMEVIERKKEMISTCDITKLTTGAMLNAVPGGNVNAFFDMFNLDKKEAVVTPESCKPTEDALAFLGL